MVRNLVKLQNEFHVPVLFCYYSKLGIVPFGSKNLVKKVLDELKDEENEDGDSWASTFDDDQEAIMNGARYDEEADAFVQSQGDTLPPRLPADLDLMVLNELVPIVKGEILKWYWQMGGTWKAIHYGEPEFAADFWPDSWPWENVTKCFTNMKKEDFTGPGNLTEFLKTVLKNRLESLGIDPAKYVVKNFTEAKRKRRQKRRGIHRERVDNEEVEMDSTYQSDSISTNGGTTEEDDRDVAGQNDATHACVEGEELPMEPVSADAENELNVSVNDDNENIEDSVDQNIQEGNLSNLIDDASLEQIENELGGLPNVDILPGLFPEGTSETSSKRRRVSIASSHSSQRSSIPPARPFSFPSEAPTYENSTLPSSTPFQRLRKTPTELNQRRVPCKEPRIRVTFSSDCPPVQNVGNCSIPRGMRNDSQNPSTSQSIHRVLETTDMKISIDLIDVFKDLSKENSAARRETGAILAGHKEGAHYILDTILIPQQVGHADRFETTNEVEIFDFFNENPTKVVLGLIHTHPGFESFLSSVDLHMLYNYACSNQSMISIVLAPELNTFPAYTLTKKGMDTLRFCQKTGFHRHK